MNIMTNESHSDPRVDQNLAAKKPHEIHISVDGEPEKTTAETLTPHEIVTTFTERDVTLVYLVRIHGNDRDSYQDRMDEPITLQNGMRFQTVSLGPTPVSDGAPPATGIAFFAQGLRDLGYEPTLFAALPDHIMFDYVVETGTQRGKSVRIGLVIPGDFPNLAPSGPHVSPRVMQPNASGAHPYGAIHIDHAKAFADAAGGEWQYWSRPAQDWNTRRKTVAAYLSHLWTLWDTQ